ncbi:helix-turn-helix domain-containing protein [Neptuniibacter sp. SY11_33]|uniref:helix-turn-helix domain-containing protein n=1 Tax=Neptuniibacter sp. SY11_33 TaxID=3398215 RepID=UPI0039F51A8C
MNNSKIDPDSLCNEIQTWATPELLVRNASGSVVVSHIKSDAYEGKANNVGHAIIGMCTDGGGHAQRKDDHGTLDDIWHPGRVGFVLPSSNVEGSAPAMEVMMVAFNLADVPACHSDDFDLANLQYAANKLHDDPILTSALITLMREAEAHGESTAFFDHGLSIILQRLTGQTTKNLCQLPKGMTQVLLPVVEQIESRLDEDLKVTEFSEQLGLSARTFTRAFKRELGQTPYQYITCRRMKRAKRLLSEGDSVTDTAFSTGFSNPAKFAAAFRRWVGLAPSEWQRINH